MTELAVLRLPDGSVAVHADPSSPLGLEWLVVRGRGRWAWRRPTEVPREKAEPMTVRRGDCP